jgi:hypothetical protein
MSDTRAIYEFLRGLTKAANCFQNGELLLWVAR